MFEWSKCIWIFLRLLVRKAESVVYENCRLLWIKGSLFVRRSQRWLLVPTGLVSVFTRFSNRLCCGMETKIEAHWYEVNGFSKWTKPKTTPEADRIAVCLRCFFGCHYFLFLQLTKCALVFSVHRGIKAHEANKHRQNLFAITQGGLDAPMREYCITEMLKRKDQVGEGLIQFGSCTFTKKHVWKLKALKCFLAWYSEPVSMMWTQIKGYLINDFSPKVPAELVDKASVLVKRFFDFWWITVCRVQSSQGIQSFVLDAISKIM